jgi:hypothetical protein
MIIAIVIIMFIIVVVVIQVVDTRETMLKSYGREAYTGYCPWFS